MYAVTASQIRELDRQAAQEFGIPSLVLMENAGRAVVETMLKLFSPLKEKRILVLCGTGNNGGDGYVLARLLMLEGVQVSVGYVDTPKSEDAEIHFKALQNVLMRAKTDKTVLKKVDPNSPLSEQFGNMDIIADALLGTGFAGVPRAGISDVIRLINESGLPVISVDVPSGINSDSGAIPGEAVNATHTVTLAYPKIGLYLPPASNFAGKIHVDDIGFDWDLTEFARDLILLPNFDLSEKGRKIDFEPNAGTIWKEILLRRLPESNKGDFGHVAILAGSRGMVGAPALTARAAQKIGTGLVTLLSPQSAQSILAAKLDEQMTIPLPEMDGSLALSAFDEVMAFAKKATLFCIGPGLTTNFETVKIIQRLLRELELPIVLDADGLNALALDPKCLEGRTDDPAAPLILTPHPGEAARLLGCNVAEVQADRITSVRELALRFRATVLLKGRHTLISSQDGIVYVNRTGNPGMAAGGMGDALTGIVGGLLAQMIARFNRSSKSVPPPVHCVALGACLHGLSGDLAIEGVSEIGVSASDVIFKLPFARKLLEESL